MNFTVPDHLPYPLWNGEDLSGTELRSCHGSGLAWIGVTLFLEDSPVEALEALSQALSLNPDSLSIREWRETCYVKLDNYDKALADLNEIVGLAPQDVCGYNNRALCYLLMGRT